MLSKIKRLINNPVYFLYHVKSINNRDGLFYHYADLAERKGLNNLYLILSFDCDTEKDIASSYEVCKKVIELGVRPVFAVPGQLLEEGRSIYRKISDVGAEFINHGYYKHAAYNEKTKVVESTLFYDQISRDLVKEDITMGDNSIQQILGIRPTGFRTPHFGTFIKPTQLNYLYSILRELNYNFSSSTTPYFGFRYGPIYHTKGMYEIPVSGSWTYPLRGLDSWGCFGAPNRIMNGMDFYKEGVAVAEYFKENNKAAILNYYVDPSHIANEPIFYKTIKKWLTVATSINYKDLLHVIKST